jgi:outer membrane receptor protein involved in Fe transport
LYPAYALYNATVGVSKDNWDLSVWVNNLADTKAVVSNNTGTGQRGDLGARLVYATPMTVGLNLSYFFK